VRSIRKWLYLLVFVFVFAGLASPEASIVWGSCPGDNLEICPDEYDIEVCGADTNDPVDQCSCEHHGYTWSGDSCEE